MGKITSESELSENPIFAEEIPAFARPKNIAAFGNSCRATSVSICEDLWLRNLGDWNLGESFCHESHSGIFFAPVESKPEIKKEAQPETSKANPPKAETKPMAEKKHDDKQA